MFGLTVSFSLIALSFPVIAHAQTSLYLAYPPQEHSTVAESIFFIGTAPIEGEVLINDQVINRSDAGHFAPSLPLQIGENKFTLRYQDQTIEITITRLATEAEIPSGVAFADDSLTPKQDVSWLQNELICFSAIAPPDSQVSVEIADQIISLLPQVNQKQLPPIRAVYYQGCTSFAEPGFLGYPLFKLSLDGETMTQSGSGKLTILAPHELAVIEVKDDGGITRTGAGTDYSRLTPLPAGARATVTGRQGEWLRLDYGAWIKQEETRLIPHAVPTQSMIRTVKTNLQGESTEIIFPLETPIPLTVQQEDETLTVTLHNTVAQIDTIRFDDHPWLKRLDWQQISPNQVQYRVHFKSDQQWGYDLRYEQSNLILTLKHPPQIPGGAILPLQGVSIVLDPGHGGPELGAKGPTGYPEKEINLLISRLIERELIKRGATVYLTRESDVELSLQDRVEMITRLNPAIALSIHYNALPDGGDAENAAGISTFWYHPQAHSLAVFIHNHLVDNLNRPDDGVYWNNLALTRCHTVPTVLLELGFMINPVEFEWIIDPQEQTKLAAEIAEAIELWFRQ
ncbi:N-acetylmuramoyl-L-alanine amidase [Gloeocapsa sp. PCC 73106]|uniref:N-acetylmuramoyl-L-alanine amidase n=1 Tax=Gloeocapsa sp. PCC 73106 TaxID=102232 RepID=UPI0002ACAD63|nr:N-acetylmuramoyl-L-alanine amidase [Gloeocapsa sp. PCC 73106]ELR99092.1 N-acetylmuramoyl-L-alanine amidase [Gloeocapsa sp. PCC 73106]